MGQTVHVIPRNDLIEHDTNGDDCVCGPELEQVESANGDGWLIKHHSLDGSEEHEHGDR